MGFLFLFLYLFPCSIIFLQRFLGEAWQDLNHFILIIAAVLSLALGIKTEVCLVFFLQIIFIVRGANHGICFLNHPYIGSRLLWFLFHTMRSMTVSLSKEKSGWSKINYSPETLVFYWVNLTSFTLSIFVVHWFSCSTNLLIVCEAWSIVLFILSDLLILVCQYS